MNLFWDTDQNWLITSSPCEGCGGYKWYILSEKTAGIWMDYICSDAQPSEEEFKKITHEPHTKEAP